MNESYSICIIDDMEDAVESLVKNIPWKEYDIRVCGTATNGKDGLSLALQEKPDIVLTDIRMPQLDGLEMVSSLLKEIPACKVVIMSGYSDFAYAQKALRLGALDYLTKPLTPQEVGMTMEKVLELLRTERDNQDQAQRLEKKIHESMPLLKREHLNLLIRYETTREAAEQRWRNLDLQLGTGRFVMMVAEIDHWPLSGDSIRIQEVEMVRFAIQNIWEETIRSETEGIVFPDAYTNRLVSIIHFSDELNVRKIGENGRINIRNYTKYTVSIGVSDPVTIEKLPQAYSQALTALSYNCESEKEAIRLVHAATQYIDNTLGENKTIGDYASHVHLSTSYFASLFKKTKGITVHQYVIREKMKLAQKLLLQDKKVQDIAWELGFEDRRYFTEVFKKVTGVTPTQFMQQYE